MTENERFKKRVRKYARENGVAPAAAARILREQHAQRRALADQPPGQADVHHGGGHTPSTPESLGVARAGSHEASPAGAGRQAITVDLSALTRGSDAKTEATFELAGVRDQGDAPRAVVDAQQLGIDAPRLGALGVGLTKGGRRSKSGHVTVAAMLAEIRALENGRFDPVLIDIGIGSSGDRDVPQRPAARQRIAAFLVSWLVRTAGSGDSQQIIAWLRERGRPLDVLEQLMLEMLLADSTLRAEAPVASPAADDPDRYLDNVISLIREELAEALPAPHRYRRSYFGPEQPEPELAELQAPLPAPLGPGLVQGSSLLGSKGGRCAGLPVCRIKCTCGGPSGPSTGLADQLARRVGPLPLGVNELLKRKAQGNGPREAAQHRRRGQR